MSEVGRRGLTAAIVVEVCEAVHNVRPAVCHVPNSLLQVSRAPRKLGSERLRRVDQPLRPWPVTAAALSLKPLAIAIYIVLSSHDHFFVHPLFETKKAIFKDVNCLTIVL